MKKSVLFKCFWGLGLLIVVGLNVGIFGYLFKGDSCTGQSGLNSGTYTSPMQPSLPNEEENLALRMIDFMLELAAKR